MVHVEVAFLLIFFGRLGLIVSSHQGCGVECLRRGDRLGLRALSGIV